MAVQELSLIDTTKISSIGDVLHTLKRLDHDLVELHMTQFVLFNKSYQVVTQLIQQGIKDNHFDHPKFIESFIVAFAGYYFNAINVAITDSTELSRPWAKLNQYATNKSAPVFISLMLGANAHINNDLPRVLVTMMRDEKPETLLGDIRKLDKILMRSGKQIIDVFEEKNALLNWLKNHVRWSYYRPAMYTILYWRIRAWRGYEKLKKDGSVVTDIENRSIRIANRILYLSNAMSKFDSRGIANSSH